MVAAAALVALAVPLVLFVPVALAEVAAFLLKELSLLQILVLPNLLLLVQVVRWEPVQLPAPLVTPVVMVGLLHLGHGLLHTVVQVAALQLPQVLHVVVVVQVLLRLVSRHLVVGLLLLQVLQWVRVERPEVMAFQMVLLQNAVVLVAVVLLTVTQVWVLLREARQHLAVQVVAAEQLSIPVTLKTLAALAAQRARILLVVVVQVVLLMVALVLLEQQE